jgi:hypothetical protein
MALLVMSMLGWGCSPAEPHVSIELRTLANSVETAVRALDQPSEAEAAEAFSWADEQFREFNLLLEDGGVVVSKQEGAIISDVGRARRLLKDQAKRRSSLPKSAERTMKQLRDLADALSSGALTDAAGNPIDSAYVARETATELKIGRDLVKALEETQNLAQRGIALRREVAARSDSLQTICRGRLARAILDGTDNTPVE